MIIDGRVYGTIFLLLGVTYLGACFLGMATIGNDRVQSVLNRIWAASAIGLVGAGLAGGLDWIWS